MKYVDDYVTENARQDGTILTAIMADRTVSTQPIKANMASGVSTRTDCGPLSCITPASLPLLPATTAVSRDGQ